MYSLIAVGGVILLLQSDTDTPKPDDQDNPVPVVVTDLWSKSSEVHRSLVSDVISDVAFKQFSDDNEKLEYIKTEMTAAYKASYSDFNSLMQEAVVGGSESLRDLSDKLKNKELQ